MHVMSEVNMCSETQKMRQGKEVFVCAALARPSTL